MPPKKNSKKKKKQQPASTSKKAVAVPDDTLPTKKAKKKAPAKPEHIVVESSDDDDDDDDDSGDHSDVAGPDKLKLQPLFENAQGPWYSLLKKTIEEAPDAETFIGPSRSSASSSRTRPSSRTHATTMRAGILSSSTQATIAILTAQTRPCRFHPSRPTRRATAM